MRQSDPTETSSSPHVSPGGSHDELDLDEFSKYIDHAKDFDTVSEGVNRVKPINEAFVRSIEVIKAQTDKKMVSLTGGRVWHALMNL